MEEERIIVRLAQPLNYVYASQLSKEAERSAKAMLAIVPPREEKCSYDLWPFQQLIHNLFI